MVIKTASLQTALEDFGNVALTGRASGFESGSQAVGASEFTLIESQNFSFDPKLEFKLNKLYAVDSVNLHKDLEDEIAQQKKTIEKQELLIKQQLDELESLKAQQLIMVEKFKQGLEGGLLEIKDSLTKQIAVMLAAVLGDVVKKTAVSAFVSKLSSFINNATKPLIIEGNKNLLEILKALIGPECAAYEFLITDSEELYVRYNEKIFATNIQSIVSKLRESYE